MPLLCCTVSLRSLWVNLLNCKINIKNVIIQKYFLQSFWIYLHKILSTRTEQCRLSFCRCLTWTNVTQSFKRISLFRNELLVFSSLCKVFSSLQIFYGPSEPLSLGKNKDIFLCTKSTDLTMKKVFLLAAYANLKIYKINLALQKLEKIWAPRKHIMTIRKLPNVTELHNQSTDEVGMHLWRAFYPGPTQRRVSQSRLPRTVSRWAFVSPGLDTAQPLWATCPGVCPS